MKKYKKITDEMFDAALVKVIDTENPKASMLLQVPGVYEVLSEHYNNAAIELIEQEERDK